MKSLKGKVAFITGGSRGMGAAIAKKLAQEGADIAITHSGRNTNSADKVIQTIKAEGVKALSLIADNENTTALISALKTAIETLGSIDILVNNAGIYFQKPIEEFTIEEYDKMMNINVKAVFVASQFAAQKMKAGGRIINIGSNMAERVTYAGGSLYAMSKSALIGLTKGMARDLGHRNITVNLIQPGPIDTDMNPADSDHAPFLLESMAIKNYGTVEEIAALAFYLSSAESKFITGSAFTIDGGFNI